MAYWGEKEYVMMSTTAAELWRSSDSTSNIMIIYNYTDRREKKRNNNDNDIDIFLLFY